MFGAIGEVIGGIFGTKKAIENLTDKDSGLLVRTGGFFNDLHYSDAEKARGDQDVREWAIRQLEALAPFKIVQRIIVFAAVGLWFFMGLNVVFATWWGVDSITQGLTTFALSDYVLYPAMASFGLYLSGGVVESFKRKG